jgi:ABC-2 type transport system ATP-binding protein
MSTMIETVNLSKRFGSITAVNNLSFSVTQGEVLGFLGPNGAGKSTTMKIITCFLAPDSGTARVCGHDILDNPLEVRSVIGYLPESAPAYGEMTVLGFLKFVGQMRGLRGQDLMTAVDRVIEMCSIKSVRHQSFETLSKGYKRRTCLAQALIHDPSVLIMDEPTDGLDPNQKHEVRELISRMSSNKVIILSTHILEEVEAICSRAVVISSGQLVADGTPDDLKRKSSWHGAVTLTIHGQDASVVKQALQGLVNTESVESLNSTGEGACRYRVFPKRHQVISNDISELTRQKNWQVDELHIEQGRLDEVFRDLTKGQKEREVLA